MVVLVVAFVLATRHDDSADGAASPAEAVSTYLEALATADADGALAVLANPPASALLTREVLARQQAAAPITDIRIIPPATGSGGAGADAGPDVVHAEYRFGDRQADVHYRTLRSGSRWWVADGVVDIALDRGNVIEPTFFGVPLGNAQRLFAFPGPWAWGSQQTFLTARAATAEDYPLGPHAPMSVTLVAGLSVAGEAAVERAVRDYLAFCAQSVQPDASADRRGCRQTLYRAAQPGSVRWTAPSDIAGLLREVSSGDARKVSVAGQIDWPVTYVPTYDGGRPISTVNDEYLYGTVDLGAESPLFTAG